MQILLIMKQRYLLPALLLALSACGSGSQKPMDTPKDQLVHRLFSAVSDGRILYGHQDDLVYGHAWNVTDPENDPLERSDVKAVTGQYPAVVGFDLGGIELAWARNLDGVPFGLIRRAAKAHIERGGIVTFSWHMRNPLTGGDAWDVSSDQAVASVLEGGEKHGEFLLSLQRAADFIASLGDVPVIFRPWHENIGSWFWWGGGLCSEEQYQDLFRYTWYYFTETRGLKNILWCYSPNSGIGPEAYMSRYPGDEFVDILGTDIYEHTGIPLEEAGVRFSEGLKTTLTFLNVLATDHHKLMCLSETGLEGLQDPTWWTETLYPAVKDFPIAYLLTWRNAHDQPGHFFAPWEGFENASDFQDFAGKEDIEFLTES